MMTPWSETLDVNRVLPEYPRPQMQRKEWVNLNGIWSLRKGEKGESYRPGFTYDQKILVPFPIESALSGIMKESDSQCYWYKRSISIPKKMKGKTILLHFGAVDWETIVYVNGIRVGSHTGGYDPFYFDITSALTDKKEQELVVYTYDNTGAEGQPKGKQALNKWGCWYTPVSGIWQTVWLEPVHPIHIQDFRVEPDVDHSALKINVETTSSVGTTMNIDVFDKQGKKVSGITHAQPGNQLTLPIDHPHLWSVDDPYLYTLRIQLIKDGAQVDAVDSYCALRKIEVKKVGGIPRIFLNNKQIFQMGPLDQGWWPDGLYTAPSDEALLFDIKSMKSLGFNMIRKHIKVEPSRWYMHCDREGILVWQDLPSPGLPSGQEDFAKRTFEEESKRIIKAFRNHPSIIQWIVFNEGWGQFDTERMTRVVESHVGQSLVCCASGWTDANVGNIRDLHSYPHPSCPSEPDRAAVCGEYGGITLKVPGHIWPGGDFQYTTVESGEDFTLLFNKLAEQIKDFYYAGLNAAVYTQLSDVEIEKNGLLTYDRRIMKPSSATGKLKDKITECVLMPQNGVKVTTILSTSRDHKYLWRYTTADDVPSQWFSKNFDDRGWSLGKAAFGRSSLWNTQNIISTPWTNSQIYMRRWFRLGNVTPEMIKKMRFVVYHDDDIEIYINGVMAASRKGSVSNYIPIDISEEAKRALKPQDRNLIAVKGSQGGGEQIMDIGISIFSPDDIHYTEIYNDNEEDSQLNAQLRQSYELKKDWEFRLDKDGSEWEKVSIPHTWNAHDGTTPDYYRGTGEYRYRLEVSPSMLEKRIFLRCEAVSQVAEVSVNGKNIGMHQGGFNAFCFELTPWMKNGNNLIQIKVSNSKENNIAPLAGDFTVFGGIYRPVSLLLLPKVCITPLDFASPGVYIRQQTDARKSRLSILTKVDNGKHTLNDLTVRTTLFNAKGDLVGSTTSQDYTEQGNTLDFTNKLDINQPVLWDGRKSPHLYRVFVEIMKGNTVLDTLSQYTGLRYCNVDAHKGFLLNGKPYQIKGVNRHQDREDKGWAISREDHREDMEIIKEIGATGIRLAHYPHSDFFYSLCDREGMLVWAEIPLVGKACPDAAFAENAKLQLTELIRQNFNHPSIFCWSLFNELSEGDVKTLVEELNDLAHREDPTRFTVAAANIENRPENKITDIMAYNTYPGWYWGEPSTMKSSLAHWNRLIGGKGIAVSEYGAGANIWHHWQTGQKTPKADGIFHPEEWQSIVHEQNYRAISEAPFVWGSFVWNMFDFASASRNEGSMQGMNDKGLVTYDRKIKKDAFYFYKSLWSEEPVLHITSKRDIARRDSAARIKVYSNCDNIVLKVNGKPGGVPTKENNIFIWENILLKKGENQINVSGRRNGIELSDHCKWIFL